MTSFESDYNNGAHPDVLQHLLETNAKTSVSYGADEWSESARHRIKTACQCPDADVCFLVGGTQTNATVIDGLLTSYEGVVAVETAHINVHESGAVEASGHKVIALPSHEGKMEATELKDYLTTFFADPTMEHMVIPGMVYLTMPTELGTIYSRHELESIYKMCRQFGLQLFIDGARLGYGLTCDDCDFDLAWMAHHCDAFYIGGTKVGALCGEAIVFTHGNAPRHFLTIVKRHGALLAKGRLTGVQFDALFTNGLYFRIARHAIDQAQVLRRLFTEAGLRLKDSPTNQQFVVLSNRQMNELSKKVRFETWEKVDEKHTLCRFVTSWATTDADLKELEQALKTLSRQ